MYEEKDTGGGGDVTGCRIMFSVAEFCGAEESSRYVPAVKVVVLLPVGVRRSIE